MCKHDATFQQDNEANGGSGCPMCRKERNAAQATPPGWFVNPAVTLELDAESAALLAQHNKDVDERKANGDKRHGGMTYTAFVYGLKK